MKKLLLLSALLSLTIGIATAQPGFQERVQTYPRDLTSVMGRDFWFQIPAMDTIDPYRSYMLNITSTKATTVNIQIGSEYDTTLTLSPFMVATFQIPLEWELQSSAVVENKGIHVWSDSADLSSMVIATSSFGSGAMQLIPSFGFGKDYAVAAYAANSEEELFGGFSGNIPDLPSEFIITAEQDGTSVEITPSTPLRKESSFGTNKASIVAYPSGEPFTVTLNKGETVQFRNIWGTVVNGHYHYDVTGTILHSNKPIAVSAGSMYANIPIYDGETDNNYVCAMIPPTRAWGRVYYIDSFPEPTEIPSQYDSNSYLFVASSANQTIYHLDSNGDQRTVCKIASAYGAYWYSQLGDQKFWSAEPFLLVQYVVNYVANSTYPYQGGYEPPGMIVIPPADDFGTTASFIVPVSVDTAYPKYPFWEHQNLISKDSPQNITIDGKPMMNDTAQRIDDSTTIYRVADLPPGAHIAYSPTGVGIYSYGYQYGNDFGTIAYPAINGTIAPAGSSDTASPAIAFSIAGTSIGATVTDTGSGLATIVLDSAYHFGFATDTSFIPGDSMRSATLSLPLTDTSASAFLRFITYDMAGNRTVGTVTFTPGTPGLRSDLTAIASSFDSVLVDSQQTLAIVTIEDTSALATVTIDTVWTDNPVFFYNPASPATNTLPIVLDPGASRLLSVTFSPIAAVRYSGNLFIRGIGDSVVSVPLSGTGYAQPPAAVGTNNTASEATIIPTNDGRSLAIMVPAGMEVPITFELVNVLGERVLRETLSMGTQSLDANLLPRGVYFYRLTSEQMSQSGKVILGE